MSKTYIAIYTTKKGGYYNHMTDGDYTSKEKFADDIKANGWHVVAIVTPEKIEEIKKDQNALTNNLNMSERLINYIQECIA